jgi:CTP:molybdopterin cytidylyltransferase MocA
MRAMPSTVLLLAGNRGGIDPVAAVASVPHKALAPVDGQPLIAHVLRTLSAMPEIHHILLVCDDPEALRRAEAVTDAEAKGILVMMPAAASPSRSVAAILDKAEFAPPMLVTTADAALLTPEMVRHFWAALPADADIAAAVTSGGGVRSRFPESRRTFLKFRDGDFCGCNLFALTSVDARRVVAFWRRLEDHRKRPLAMAAMVGPGVILAYLLRRLSLASAARHLSRRTTARAAIVPIPFPEAAVDVDKPADIAVAERVLAERRAKVPATPSPEGRS